MDVLGVGKLPYMSRRNFVYEFIHLLPWSVLAGVVEGQFASVVVSKTFHGSGLLIAVAAGMPYAAYISSLFWGMLCVGRPKIQLSMLAGAGTAIFAALAGMLPASANGAVVFIIQIAIAQLFLAGVVTVRAAIWQANYPPDVRGQIAAKLQGIRSVISILAVQSASALCDWRPEAYRLVYPGAAILGLLGITLLKRVRIRGQCAELRRSSSSGIDSVASHRLRAYSIANLLSPIHAWTQMMRIFRSDPRFTRYCVAQTLHGAANLMTIAVIVAVISRELITSGSQEFWISSGLITALPILALLGSLRRWGLLFDSLGVLRFRVVNVMCWTASLALGLAGTMATRSGGDAHPTLFLAAIGLFALRAVVNGVAQGGGTLAWNLGHLHFASQGNADIYMGIHVFLAGVRGLIAPLAGMWLYTYIGSWIWLIAIAMSLSSLSIYHDLAEEGDQLAV